MKVRLEVSGWTRERDSEYIKLLSSAVKRRWERDGGAGGEVGSREGTVVIVFKGRDLSLKVSG